MSWEARLLPLVEMRYHDEEIADLLDALVEDRARLALSPMERAFIDETEDGRILDWNTKHGRREILALC